MPHSATTSNWVAADLSRNTLRLWVMQGDSAQHETTAPTNPARVVEDLTTLIMALGISGPVNVLLSGAALAAPELVPCKPLGRRPRSIRTAGPMHLHALPGLQQSAPVAVMQGDETRISGFLQLNHDWDGVICLPGPVTQWTQVSAGEVVSFQSALTVQLYQMLGGAADWDQPALADATADALSNPERLAARLAEIQAQTAVQHSDKTQLDGRLWGILLGVELAATRPYWLGQNLALIGDDDLAHPYMTALQAQGLLVTLADAKAMALAGLVAAWKKMQN